MPADDQHTDLGNDLYDSDLSYTNDLSDPAHRDNHTQNLAANTGPTPAEHAPPLPDMCWPHDSDTTSIQGVSRNLPNITGRESRSSTPPAAAAVTAAATVDPDPLVNLPAGSNSTESNHAAAVPVKHGHEQGRGRAKK